MLKFIHKVENWEYQDIQNMLFDMFFNSVCKNISIKQSKLSELHKKAIASKYFDLVAIAMSYLALNNYKNGAKYYQTLQFLNDARYLANSSKSPIAQKINTFIAAIIEYQE